MHPLGEANFVIWSFFGTEWVIHLNDAHNSEYLDEVKGGFLRGISCKRPHH